MSKSEISYAVWKQLTGYAPTPEYRPIIGRRWRIDYAFCEQRIAVEIEGGVWTRGRHTRGAGFIGDMEKYNALAEDGWYLLRYQPGKVDFAQIKRVLERIDSYNIKF